MCCCTIKSSMYRRGTFHDIIRKDTPIITPPHHHVNIVRYHMMWFRFSIDSREIPLPRYHMLPLCQQQQFANVNLRGAGTAPPRRAHCIIRVHSTRQTKYTEYSYCCFHAGTAVELRPLALCRKLIHSWGVLRSSKVVLYCYTAVVLLYPSHRPQQPGVPYFRV